MSDMDQAYQLGLRDGYAQGESERVALATTNSQLRSELLALHQWVDIQCDSTPG